MKHSILARLCALCVGLMLSGCASYDLIKPAPAATQPIQVSFNGEGASGWSDLPIGAYRVPQSQVIITGHQTGGVGILFGVVGILAQDAVQTAQGKSAVANVQSALQLDVTSQAQELSDRAIDAGGFGTSFARTAAGGSAVLTVTPYIIVTFVNDTDVRPYVFLKASLQGTGSKVLWSSRYIISADKALPLEGEHSFTADGGAPLKAAIGKDLETGIRFMLADVAAPKPRDEGKLLYVEAAVPFMRQRVGMVGYELMSDDHSVAIAPKIADAAVFAGVEYLDKSAITWRAATADDKFKLLDEGN